MGNSGNSGWLYFWGFKITADGFSSGHVWMWELDYKESWAWKNWCFWTVVLEKTLENPLDCKEIQPVHSKRDQSWIFIGRTDVEAETAILWPPHTKSWLIWTDPDAVKDWGQEEKGMTEDEMVGWHHWLNGHGLCGLRELVMDREAWHAEVHGVSKSRTWLSNWTELIHLFHFFSYQTSLLSPVHWEMGMLSAINMVLALSLSRASRLKQTSHLGWEVRDLYLCSDVEKY